MKFVNRPKVEYRPDGLPRAQESKRPFIFRILVGVTLFLALSLNLYVFIRADIATLILDNSAAAEGIIIDIENRPIPNALVFSADFPAISTETDENGRFQLDNLPEGVNRIVVVRNNVGQEFFITLAPDKLNRLDYLSFTAPWEDIE